MSIHKFQPELAGAEPRPFQVGVSFQHDLYDLADTIVKTRAIQTFDRSAIRYPIYRELRIAATRAELAVFDDLALQTGLSAHRIDTGTLLLDGPGVFVDARGYRKAQYTSCEFQIWADSLRRAQDTIATLESVVGPCWPRDRIFVADWQFCNERMSLTSTAFDELVDGDLLDEAYPALGDGVASFIARYLAAEDTVLLLLGPPGTGKTRLVRAIMAALSARKGDSARVMYTADKRALESDELYVDFITGSHEAFVVEDADHLLQARSDGNRDLHRFLMIADGVVRAQGRKIIFTTNLPNLGSVDEALLRPGRCFASVHLQSLTREQVATLVQRLCRGESDVAAAVLERLLAAGQKAVSVAQAYRTVGRVRSMHCQTGNDAAKSGHEKPDSSANPRP